MFPLEDIASGARLLYGLPVFLRQRIGPEQARRVLRQRLERREPDFLALVRRAVYAHNASPYRSLLQLASCEYGDLEELVGREGVEGALRALYRHGVYLTIGELKGRRPVVRGSATLRVDPGQLHNPSSSVHLSGRTSGSRGAGTVVTADLAYLRGNAVNTALAFEACCGIGWRHAVWGVPGGVAIYYILQYSAFGAVPERWFSQVDPASPGLHGRYRWSVRLVRWASLLAGVPLPGPEYVSLDHPLPIVKWMAGVLRAGGRPHLHTFLSSAVRLCQAALTAGLDLRGSVFTVTGEPITEAGLAVIQRAGGKALPRYASAECGPIGLACLAREAPDEVHLLHDRLAMIQSGEVGESAALPPSAVLVSSLRARAPLILLNVSLGDRAVMVRRACGCPMECFGWSTHLHTIRSYDKLTAGGMTFLDTDVIHVLEDFLPARFGGGPTDYQLLEDQSNGGQSGLRLLVHPRLGPLDTGSVADCFLATIGAGSGVERVMELQWRAAGTLRVERRAPLAAASGKILHLHQEHDASGSDR